MMPHAKDAKVATARERIFLCALGDRGVRQSGFSLSPGLRLRRTGPNVVIRMLRWLLLVISVFLFGLSLLTVVKSPDWVPWRLGVLAGEFGHWLAVAALGLALSAWFARAGAGVWAVATCGPALVATGLFLKPSWQAWRVAAELPAKLTAQFGAHEIARPAFSIRGLFENDPAPVAVKPLNVAPDLPLDFYPADRANAPCVIAIHGGGWDSGDRTQIAHFNHWIARHGFAVAAISYRLAPKSQWPAPREDVLARRSAREKTDVPTGQ